MAPKVVRRATAEDREFVAWSILTATRGHLSKGWFDISLNRSESDCLKFLAELTTITPRSPWHYSRFLLAGEDASRPVAAFCGVPYPEGYEESGVALLTCMKRFGLGRAEREAFQRRGAYLFLCTTPPDSGSVAMEVSATLPSSRKQGYRTLLVQYTLEDARSKGFKKAETSCFVGNSVSERNIARTGFTFVDEKRHPDFEAISGSPGIRRFARDLTSTDLPEAHSPIVPR